MKSAKHYNWLQIVEGCSVASCIAGSIASVVYQQLAYASAPLALALSLNLINRSRFLSQMRQQTRSAMVDVHRSVESLDQKVQALPTKTTDDSINKSLFQLQQTIETLTGQFNARPETQEVEQLGRAIAQLANHLNILSLRFDSRTTPKEIDTSKIESEITTLGNQLNVLVKQVNAKPEAQALEQLNKVLEEVQQKTKAQIQGLEANLRTFDLNRTSSNTAINSNIARLQNQTDQLSQHRQDLPPPFDPSPLEERIAQQEQSYHNIATQYNRVVQVIQTEITKIRQSIATVQDSAATAIVEARSSFLEEIESLRARLDALPTPTDLTPVEEAIALLRVKVQNIDTLTTQLQTELQTQINGIHQHIQNLSPPFDPSGLEQRIGQQEQTYVELLQSQLVNYTESITATAIAEVSQRRREEIETLKLQIQAIDLSTIKEQLSELERKNHQLSQDYVQRLVPAVKGLRSDRASTQEAIAHISHQFATLELKLNNLLIPTEAVDFSEIEQAIASLKCQLGDLTQQFNTREEPTAIERLEGMIALAIQRLDNLPPLPEPVDFSEVKELKTEVEQLDQRLQIVSRLDSEIDSLRQVLSQINEIQQHLNDLDISSGDLHDYARRLKNEVEERTTQIHLATVELDERIQRLLQIPEQLEAVEHLSAGLDKRTQNIAQIEQQLESVQRLTAQLDEKTGYLLNNTRNQDEMQQQLTNLQQLITEYAKTEDLEGILGGLREELSGQVDLTVEKRVGELNQLLKEIQPAYEYKLVCDRSGSRDMLMEALNKVQQRLIMVNPWLSNNVITTDVLSKFRQILNRQGEICIGWGNLYDTEGKFYPTRIIRQQFLQSVPKNLEWKYNALPKLQELERDYSELFHLKFLGTHEKFLVCDHSWAMLGSHNFLTSGNKSTEREVGLQTNDPRIIADLILRFDNARDLEEEG